MKLQCAQLLLTTSIGVVRATSPYMLHPPVAPQQQPTFYDESPPNNGVPLPREAWHLKCSTDRPGYECKKAIDGNSSTAWMTEGSSFRGHSITVDLGSPQILIAVVILPFNDTSGGGLITQHEIYVSNDEENWKGPVVSDAEEDWEAPVAYGMWPDTNRQRMAIFEPKSARYIKVKTSAGGNEVPWVGISDLNIYRSLYTIPQDPTGGVWGPTIDFPIVPVAGAQQASGQIILWSAWAPDSFLRPPGGQTSTSQWDPSTKIVTKRLVSNTHHDMFCPGISTDGTGMIVVTGGNSARQTSLYNASTPEGEWKEGPPMLMKRGYQSSTTLSDGRVFVIGGSWSADKGGTDGEIYDPYAKTWTLLPGALVQPMLTDDMAGKFRSDNHGWLFGWTNQTIFQAGPSQAMNWYYVDGEGSFKAAGKRANDDDSMSGNAVMFDAVHGKILTFGGSPSYSESEATDSAHIITLGKEGKIPEVKLAAGHGKMHYRRVFHTSVVLPDGKVFIAGGQSLGIPFDENNVQFVPELYDPEIDKFIKLQQNNIIRVYHSLSILLPDARVLNGGGGLCDNCAANHYNAQIFTPPYLLTKDQYGELRERPEIVELPKKVQVGTVLTFITDRAIKNASMVRLGSASHTVNTDQRRIPLDIGGYSSLSPRAQYQYTAQLPGDPGIIIPGYWMVFIMDKHGVPSISKTVMVTVDDTEETIESSKEVDSKVGEEQYALSGFKAELIK